MGDNQLSTVFQPVVDLSTGKVAAVEALTRTGRGAGASSPEELIRAAREAGSVLQLDEACWRSSLVAVAARGFSAPFSVLLNIEPESFQAGLQLRFPPEQPTVIELTERALMSSPGELLTMVHRVRSAGHGIAIDDLGAEPASLALLPLIRPDVVKLDMRVVQSRPDAEVALIMSALNRHAHNHDVIVIAEGIETKNHLVTARALGATHGQGWYFAAPHADSAPPKEVLGLPIQPHPIAALSRAATPYDVVSERVGTKLSDRALLVQMSIFLEARAAASGNAAVVLASFQHATNITAVSARRYRALAASCALVMAFTHGPSPRFSDSGVRVIQIQEGDRLLEEWDIVVLTPDFAAILVARELDATAHTEGAFEFVLSHDRELAVEAAHNLLLRSAASRTFL